MKTAKRLLINGKQLRESQTGAIQKLWELKEDTPDGVVTSYVVTSSVFFCYTGSETLIFPSDEKGDITSFTDLEGSYRGGLDHEKALKNAGYEIINDLN